MKVISVMQPFASLLSIGAKTIETRKRDFTGGYRGPIAIHASLGEDYMHLCSREPFYSVLKAAGFKQSVVNYKWYLPMGEIVAVGDLVDVRPTAHNLDLTQVTILNHLSNVYPQEYFCRKGAPSLMDMAKRELAFGDYSPGRFMLLLKNVVALDKPIPARGRLGLWNYDMEDPRGTTHA